MSRHFRSPGRERRTNSSELGREEAIRHYLRVPRALIVEAQPARLANGRDSVAGSRRGDGIRPRTTRATSDTVGRLCHLDEPATQAASAADDIDALLHEITCATAAKSSASPGSRPPPPGSSQNEAHRRCRREARGCPAVHDRSLKANVSKYHTNPLSISIGGRYLTLIRQRDGRHNNVRNRRIAVGELTIEPRNRAKGAAPRIAGVGQQFIEKPQPNAAIGLTRAGQESRRAQAPI